MISIPIAANIPSHRMQLDLFWDNHQHIYGDLAAQKAHAIIILQEETYPHWNIGIPHTIAKDWHHFYPTRPKQGGLVPLNIQIGLQQIIHNYADDQILELLDCDMFHIRQAPEQMPQDNEFLVNTLYEDWHLKSLSDNKHIISKHLIIPSAYNGGFVPIVGKAKTFKMIIQTWIDNHLKIYDQNPSDPLTQWWAGMYSFQIACSNLNIKMTATNNCYFPNINNLEEEHYNTHYCCDTVFDKKKHLPNLGGLSIETLPDNLFYNRIKDWYLRKVS